MTLRLLVIVGPTAVGKTRLGVDVAHRLGSEIVSVDSRQVYRGLDIGTGKDLEEYSRVDPPVPVHLLDLVEPDEVYSLALFLNDCRRLFEAKAAEPRFGSGAVPLVMVGGTGLYVEAVLRGFRVPEVPPDDRLRRELETQPHDLLVERLRGLAPHLAETTDLASTRRVIRGLEIALQVGDDPPRVAPMCPFESRVFGIRVDRELLRQRIADRVRARLELGMVEEVRGLLDRGVTPARLCELGLEYREITAHLVDGVPYEEMVDRLILRIRQFSKRQQTWFRGMERRGIPITWVASGDVEAILAAASSTH